MQHYTICSAYTYLLRNLFTVSEVTSTTVISHAPCKQNPCHNGGTCVDQADDKYKCVCKIGYEGKNCEEKEQKGIIEVM